MQNKLKVAPCWKDVITMLTDLKNKPCTDSEMNNNRYIDFSKKIIHTRTH